MAEIQYRIEYQLQRRIEGEADYTEIGFGSSGGWGDIDAAAYAIESDIQNRSWETEPGHPEPKEVDR